MEGGVGKERGRGRWEKRKKTAGGQGGKAVKREREGEEGRKNEAQNTKQNVTKYHCKGQCVCVCELGADRASWNS